MFEVRPVDTWTAVVENRVGGLRDLLAQLAQAGANLEVIVSRRGHDAKHGVLFVAPIVGDAQVAVAERIGLRRASSLHTLRVSGLDEPGVAYLLAHALAQEGLNVRGFSAATLGPRMVIYIAFDSAEDAARAMTRLRSPL